MSSLTDILGSYKEFSQVIVNSKSFKRLDFSISNPTLLQRDLSDTKIFTDYIFEELLSNNSLIGVGGYEENRVIYRQREHFTNEKNPRCIHLGTDIWTNAGEIIYSPHDAVVHSFAFNNQYGDYGPTIILKHELEGFTFYTLYGHLSLDSLEGLFVGKQISSGEKFARIGAYPINGDWPPHLHFQIISEIGEYKGDFPGVCSIPDREYYLKICPDSNLILRIGENF